MALEVSHVVVSSRIILVESVLLSEGAVPEKMYIPVRSESVYRYVASAKYWMFDLRVTFFQESELWSYLLTPKRSCWEGQRE